MHKTKFALVALALLAMLPTFASAQVGYGLRGGLSMYKMGGNDVKDISDVTGYRTGINVTGFVNMPVSDILSIQGGLGYSQRGIKFTEDDVSLNFAINYIEFQALAKISPEMSGSVGVDLFLGPTLGYEVGCKIGAAVGDLEVQADCPDKTVNSTDIAILGGAGVNFSVTDQASVVLQGFYNYGITGIDEGTLDLKNRGFVIVAGISYTP